MANDASELYNSSSVSKSVVGLYRVKTTLRQVYMLVTLKYLMYNLNSLKLLYF